MKTLQNVFYVKLPCHQEQISHWVAIGYKLIFQITIFFPSNWQKKLPNVQREEQKRLGNTFKYCHYSPRFVRKTVYSKFTNPRLNLIDARETKCWPLLLKMSEIEDVAKCHVSLIEGRCLLSCIYLFTVFVRSRDIYIFVPHSSFSEFSVPRSSLALASRRLSSGRINTENTITYIF